ncbi:MAG: amino acid permease [Acidobacteria bacterium]|nr:amino acid permease [Acidobacteriota bacterium]
MIRWLKKLLIGTPLETAMLHEQRLTKKAALPILASDNLSSSAYATEEIVVGLMAGASVGMAFPLYYAIPIALAIGLLTGIVAISYGQTLHAYPTGGGAYTVAKENLGITPALVAGSALLVDYVLTVAVSVAAGIAAITSAIPSLYNHRVALAVLTIFVILVANLRGVRESAAVFSGPVYLFIGCAFLLILGGLARYYTSGAAVTQTASVVPSAPLWNSTSVFLLLHAFASGCAALTGIEAVANGVTIFRPPVSRNASTVLYILATLLTAMFFGITVLTYLYGIHPQAGETMLSQLGRAVFGTGPVYYTIQAATMAILVLAANTSFADFPRLSSVMAKDRFLPRQLANMGDRLVFSNGMLVLALLASLLVITFQADVHLLIPLYMVGVFVSFTLSQAGMVGHWRRSAEKRLRRWHIGVNAFGAATTFLVLMVVAFVKFLEGAWVIAMAIPLIVWICLQLRRHYFQVGRELSLTAYEKPRDLLHTAIVPVAGLNRMVLAAVEYARSISKDVIAVSINVDQADPEKLEQQWEEWAPDVPLVVLNSPYRAIQRPLLQFIREVENWRNDDVVTVVIPEFVAKRWWHQFLHNQTSLFLKAALVFQPRIVVVSVRQHLRR